MLLFLLLPKISFEEILDIFVLLFETLQIREGLSGTLQCAASPNNYLIWSFLNHADFKMRKTRVNKNES